MIYFELIRFLLPLVVTMFVQELGTQVLNGGMARMPRATETLAAFGLAWGLVMFLATVLMQARQLGLVLVEGRDSYRTARLFVLIVGLVLAGVLAIMATGPVGDWVVEDLHAAERSLGLLARQIMLWLTPIPLLRGLFFFYSGLLIRMRRTDLVSYAMLASMAASIGAVFLLLPMGFVQAKPIWLPILVTYASVAAELAVIGWGYRRAVRPSLGEAGRHLSYRYITEFFWPLALIMAIQGVSRPMINLFVAREPNGTDALAVLTVVYALGHLVYGWLNEIRNLPAAFQDRDGSLRQIRRFAIGCGLLSFGIMVIAYWTPLRDYVLQTLIGLDADLATLAAVPLILFSFFPLVVMARAYLHGVGLVARQTRAMAPSAPLRALAILVALIVLPAFGVHGAARGVAALLCGFAAETLAVWWGIRGKIPQQISELVQT
jgi:hypothetical protein